MIQAQTPDGVIHQFPDGTPQAAIDKAMRDYVAMHPAHPTAAQDVGLGALTGGAQGAGSFFGFNGDMANLPQTVADAVEKFANRHGYTTPFAGAKIPPVSPLPPIVTKAVNAVASGIAKATGTDPRIARYMAALTPGLGGAAPTSAEMQSAFLHDTAPYQPKTTAGKYARTIAQFAPAALMPVGAKSVAGQLAQHALNAAVPGVASETAGELTEGTPYEPWARAAAAVLGGLGTTYATAPRPATSMLASASRGATDEQVQAAQQLMASAQSRGIKLTLAEALQQVTDNATGMGRLQRVLEGTQQGEERFGPVMAARPDQVRGAVMNYADSLTPATDQPSMIGGAAQGAADAGLNDIRRLINNGASDSYAALRGQHLTPEQYAPLGQNPSYVQALTELRGSPELGAAVADLPDNNLAVVNEVEKRLGTLADQVRPSAVNPGGDAGLSSLREQAAGLANQVGSAASEDWRNARQTVAQGRAAYLEPLQRGPLGSVATDPTVKGQTAALFPSQPLEGAAAETARSMGLLGFENPDVPRALSRQHLVNALNEATQDLQSGPNQYGGAKYAAVIAGNPEQRATLLSGVDAAGGNASDLSDLLDALSATGKRQAQGSKTAFNTSDLKNLGSLGPMAQAVKGGLDPFEIPSKLADAFTRWQMGRNIDALANALLADPDKAAQALSDARAVSPPDFTTVPSLEYLLLSRRKQEQPNAP